MPSTSGVALTEVMPASPNDVLKIPTSNNFKMRAVLRGVDVVFS